MKKLKSLLIFIIVIGVVIGIYFFVMLHKDKFLLNYEGEYLAYENPYASASDENHILNYFFTADLYDEMTDEQIITVKQNTRIMNLLKYSLKIENDNSVEKYLLNIPERHNILKSTKFGDVNCFMNQSKTPLFCLAYSQDMKNIYYYSRYRMNTTTSINNSDGDVAYGYDSNRYEKIKEFAEAFKDEEGTYEKIKEFTEEFKDEEGTYDLIQNVKSILNEIGIIDNILFEPDSFYLQKEWDTEYRREVNIYSIQDTKNNISVTYDLERDEIYELRVNFVL